MARGTAAWVLGLLVAGLATQACGTGPAATAHAPADESWLQSYADAKALAAKEQKALLLDFTGSDWCHWCIKLKSEVFDTREFKEWAEQNVVLVEVDFPEETKLPADVAKQNHELKDKFAITGFPTVVFTDAEGNELGRTGYVKGGPAAFLKEANARLGRPAGGK